MYDHENVKTKKVIWSLSQNLLYNFFKWISYVIFPPSSSVLEAHFQEPSTLENHDLPQTSFHKILNRKIIIIHFQNQIFGAKTRLPKDIFQKNRILQLATW